MEKIISLLVAPSSRLIGAYRNAEDRNRWADFVHGANLLWGHGAKLDR